MAQEVAVPAPPHGAFSKGPAQPQRSSGPALWMLEFRTLIWSSGSWLGDDACRGPLAMSEDIFGHHNWGLLLALVKGVQGFC